MGDREEDSKESNITTNEVDTNNKNNNITSKNDNNTNDNNSTSVTTKVSDDILNVIQSGQIKTSGSNKLSLLM